MPKLTIDNRAVEVPPGATILDAAQKLGIAIPTLCHLNGYKPSTSCLVCTVKVCDGNRLVPSCGTEAMEGMAIESETSEVHEVRKSALELLLSDHVGDCLAPCYFACPAHMDIPLMLRQIGQGQSGEAIATVKDDIALPAVLGRICPKPCEGACRRRGADGAVAICELKRFVADTDLRSGNPYVPECRANSGKHVAIVGAGPTGLSAAYYLRQNGHSVTVFDERPKPGGRLGDEFPEDELPRDVLDAEIEQIAQLGVDLRFSTLVAGNARSDHETGDSPGDPQSRGGSEKMGLAPGPDPEKPGKNGLPRVPVPIPSEPRRRPSPTSPLATTLADLQREFDAVLVACGATAKEKAEDWGLAIGQRGIDTNQGTFETNLPGVFAAGNAIRTKGLVVRSVADGKEAAQAIHQYVSGQAIIPIVRPFSAKIGRLAAQEISHFLARAADAPRREPATGAGESYAPAEAAEQADRCLACGCCGHGQCRLEEYAAIYQAVPGRYRGERRPFTQIRQDGSVIYEPGKCIDCGLCVQITAAGGEPLGLSFIGRGFDVRVGVPFNKSLREALTKVAADCVTACPTAALSFADQQPVHERRR